MGRGHSLLGVRLMIEIESALGLRLPLGLLYDFSSLRALSRRLQVIGSTLRARPALEKASIVKGFLARFGDALAAGNIAPV